MKLDLLISILVGIVAAFHLYVMWLEMFAWTTRGPKVFSQFPKELFPQTKTLAANQGLYNGFLAAGLIWSFFICTPEWRHYVQLFFLSCVAVAGIYGGATASKKIFFVQGIPALVGIGLIIFSIQIVEKRVKKVPEIKAWYVNSNGRDPRDTFELGVGNKINEKWKFIKVIRFMYREIPHDLSFYTIPNPPIDGDAFYIGLDSIGRIYGESLTWGTSMVLKTNNDSLNDIILVGLSNAMIRTELKDLLKDPTDEEKRRYWKLISELRESAIYERRTIELK